MFAAYLLLPVFVQAQISINIQASDTAGVSARATGQSETIIKTNHKEIFHLTDQLLKNAIFKLTGQYGEVFLKEPSPGNDVYGSYKLDPVKTLLKTNGTKILNVIKEEVVLNKLQTFNHEVTSTSQYITLAGSIEDKFSVFWKQIAVFPINIAYSIDVNSFGGSHWNITSTFGRNLFKTQTIPVTGASFAVNLGPKTDATAVLSATKVTLVVQVNYVASLSGHVLTKFDENYVWGYENHDIKTVMAAAAMPDTVILSEEITVNFYTDCVIKLFGQDLNATKGVSQCAFTINDPKNESNVNWTSAQYKSQVKSTDSVIVPELKGNGVSRNSEINLLLVTSLIMIIQRL